MTKNDLMKEMYFAINKGEEDYIRYLKRELLEIALNEAEVGYEAD